MMINVDDLNKTIMAFNKYIADRQRHDLNVSNAIQKRVYLKQFFCGTFLENFYFRQIQVHNLGTRK